MTLQASLQDLLLQSHLRLCFKQVRSPQSFLPKVHRLPIQRVTHPFNLRAFIRSFQFLRRLHPEFNCPFILSSSLQSLTQYLSPLCQISGWKFYLRL